MDRQVETPQPIITNKIRTDWNDYVSWLRQHGLAGNPDLDKQGLGKDLLTQYIKKNPSTSLTLDLITPIQQDFQKYRQYALDQVKAGKAQLPEGSTEDDFMKELSVIDGYPGQFTTRHTFPSSYMQFINDSGQVEKTVNQGFATAGSQ